MAEKLTNHDLETPRPELTGLKAHFYQEEDTASDRPDSDLAQSLEIELVYQAGFNDGPYFVIKTERWAINDSEELVRLIQKTAEAARVAGSG